MKERIDSPIYKRLQQKSHKNKEYRPTKHAITRWFNVINREIFDNGLAPFDVIEIKRLQTNWAMTISFYDHDGDVSGCDLQFRYKFPNFRVFLITLAHEMVHKFQWEELGIVNHGPTFYAWRPTFAKHGLSLSLTYSDSA